MGDVIITYETLYEIFHREKNRPELQRLDATFFSDALNYLNEKKRILESQSKQESLFAQAESSKTKKQLENINKILRDIYEKRERKIIEMALFASRVSEENIDLSNMLPEEVEIFKSFTKILNRYRSGIFINLLSFKKPETNGFKLEEAKEINTSFKIIAKQGYKMVKIINPISSFVGTDLKIYGPYNGSEIVELPEEVVELLLKKDKVILNEDS